MFVLMESQCQVLNQWLLTNACLDWYYHHVQVKEEDDSKDHVNLTYGEVHFGRESVNC